MERALIAQYEQDITEILESLSFLKLPLAVELASLPDGIRGFGHIKERSAQKIGRERERLLAAWRAPQAQPETTVLKRA